MTYAAQFQSSFAAPSSADLLLASAVGIALVLILALLSQRLLAWAFFDVARLRS